MTRGAIRRSTAIGPEPVRALRTALCACDFAPSALQDLLRAASGPDVVSFALGLPATEALPAAICREAFQAVMEAGPGALQYGPPSQLLKQRIVNVMARCGVTCNERQVFVTTGAQQALNLLTRLFVGNGDSILVEELLYPGFRQIAETCGARLLSVPSSPKEGIDIDAVTSLLRSGKRPALMFVMGRGHNPLGVSVPRPHAFELVKLASQYRIPILEDDAYGLLSYSATSTPALRSLDDEVLFYVGSFSKIFAPELRVGWIVAPDWAIPRLSILKEATDLDTCPLSHKVVAWLLSCIDLDQRLNALCALYRERRDSMIHALSIGYGETAEWTEPDGGFCVWVRLCERIDTSELLKRSMREERIAFVPGASFAIANEERYRHCMRLNFSACSPEKIKDGIARLARVSGALRV